MFCGSCMQDNTLARTLRLAGEDAVLVPTYTPITVDEEDVSVDRVFLGGVNVYLDSVVPGWRRLPGWMTSWLNRPAIIRGLTKFGGGTEASKLGSLTLDMLKGDAGPQRREIHQFVNYLCDELKPDVIIFSNALLSGVLTELRPRFNGRILCLLQGDDIFLEGLTAKWKPRVMKQLQANCQLFDGFLTHSRFYRDFMAGYLNVPVEKFRQIPLSIDPADVVPHPPPETVDRAASADRKVRVGFFARICREKGVLNFLTASKHVLTEYPNTEFAVAGYLPAESAQWFEELLAEASAVAPGRVHWLGSPAGRSEKFRIYSSFDLLCVPTDYHEPKGLYVLEAGLAGVPSLLPNHGAFPELVEALGHGTLYDATTESGLVEGLQQHLARTPNDSATLPQRVHAAFAMQATAEQLVETIRSF